MTSSSLGDSTHLATLAATRCWYMHISISKQTLSDPLHTSLGTSLLGRPLTSQSSPKQTSCLPTPKLPSCFSPQLSALPTPEVSTQEALNAHLNDVNPTKRGEKLP